MKYLFSILLAFIFLSASAQNVKVKIKKQTVYINDKAELNLVGADRKIEGSTFLVKSVESNETLFSVHYLYHNGYYNCEVSFLNPSKKMRVKTLNYKDFFKNLYEQSVITENGLINEKSALQFIQLYDVTPEKRVIIID